MPTEAQLGPPRRQRVRAPLAAALLLLFGLPAAAIDFFHTDHGANPSDSCPACQLHQSATAVQDAEAPDLPTPAEHQLESICLEQVDEPFFRIKPDSRSPPIV